MSDRLTREQILRGIAAAELLTADVLKPCPFCGAQPYMDDRGEMGGGWSIMCGCVAAPGVLDRRRESAIEFWNRRAPSVVSGRSND